MIKIKNNKLVLFLMLAVALLIISACSKAECKTTSDCLQKQCALSKCENKKCVYTQQTNCCGNNIPESIESGKSGNKCTCPQDYEKCEGKPKVKNVYGREEEAQYAHYFCNYNSQCVLGVESKDLTPQNFLDVINSGYFKASAVLKYSKPFDLSQGSFELKITLDDTSKDLILPVKFTNVKVLYLGDLSKTELLIADKELDSPLEEVGDSITISAPLNLNYKPQEAEETGSIRYTLDYSYAKNVPSGRTQTGETIYNAEQARDKFNSPPKQIFFVRTG